MANFFTVYGFVIVPYLKIKTAIVRRYRVPKKKKSSPDPRRASARALMEAKAEELHRKILNIRLYFLKRHSLIIIRCREILYYCARKSLSTNT
jgi:hypothetical protein